MTTTLDVIASMTDALRSTQGVVVELWIREYLFGLN